MTLPSRGARLAVLAAGILGSAGLMSACSSAGASSAPPGVVSAVGAENEYADVIAQVGGRYVKVSAIESNPNTDPHTFEASPSVAAEVAGAELVVQNGVGYDTYMNRIESAQPSSNRRVVDVQHVLGLPDDTPNPHLWYDPETMPLVAQAVAADLEKLAPAHAAVFAANLQSFDASLRPWKAALSALKDGHGGSGVATTEPVADYMLQAAGLDNLSPFVFQADVMNGVDPSPQDVTLERGLFTGHRVKVLVYNQQVTDSLTTSLAALAKSEGIPVVGVYETMPTPGYDYQSWMLAEVQAVDKAIADGVSTTKL